MELALGDYTVGRFAWRLERAQRLATPVPFTGRQDCLYLLPEPAAAQVRVQLPPRWAQVAA